MGGLRKSKKLTHNSMNRNSSTSRLTIEKEEDEDVIPMDDQLSSMAQDLLDCELHFGGEMEDQFKHWADLVWGRCQRENEDYEKAKIAYMKEVEKKLYEMKGGIKKF